MCRGDTTDVRTLEGIFYASVQTYVHAQTDRPTDRPTCASSLDAASISNSPLPAVEAAQVNYVCAPEQPMQSGIRDPVLGLTAKARYQHRRR